jgi:hypothetical protein
MKIDRFRRERQQSLQGKTSVPTLKEHVEALRSVVITVTAAYGIVALFCFCFFQARFIPSGVSMGDTLLFAFLALALGFIGLVLSLMGSIPWWPFFYPFGTKPSAEAEAWTRWIATGGYPAICAAYYVACLAGISAGLLVRITVVAAAGILLAGLAATHLWKQRGLALHHSVAIGSFASMVTLIILTLCAQGPLLEGLVVLVGTLLGGVFLVFSLPDDGASASAQPISTKLRQLFVAGAILLPVLIVAVGTTDPAIRRLVFDQLGLYAEDASMEVSGKNLQTLTAAAELQG